ncbi:50S ribosomal protein L3 [Candidatus Daviesbacteria bacterium RIFCSPLOWO2_02_FULL_36_8]|uniref:50S ribosomal protein L3 n=1 Tax=Candidatus Daviesbacteria bacterium RIFCSPLOWO2_02_FULL_36_8 TaxID=1797793 RepID=A0A1F5MFF3_9BACT|nr:MAG: 50S ribosomal protein L3 [Candidatus Daviesbacteria bacterium RIFCSPLOWO2_02_FULL_36_8]
MVNTLMGIKKNMTSTYDSRGRRVGATVVEITPNYITQLNAASIQLGFGTKKSVKKPQLGHGKKAGIEMPIRWFREVAKTEGEDLKPGTEVKLEQVFSIGDEIKVSGTSKGKGFQGGVRRWGFHGGPKTHGQSDRHRAPGSIGSGTTPGRVYKGKKMAGHMGNVSVSTRGLEVVALDKDKNLLIIKGAVPGYTGGLIMITKLGRIKGYTPPPEEKPSEDEETAASVDSGEPKEAVVEPVAEIPVEEVKKEEVVENA